MGFRKLESQPPDLAHPSREHSFSPRSRTKRNDHLERSRLARPAALRLFRREAGVKSPKELSPYKRTVSKPLHQILHLQLSLSALPRIAKLLLDEPRVITAVLGFQRLMQPEQRPRISWILLQILPKHFLRPLRIATHQQHTTERLAHREKPVRRLSVLQRVL